MARTTPVNKGYTIINGTATGSNAAYVDVWIEYKLLAQSIENNYSVVHVLFYSAATRSSSTAWSVAERFGYVGYNNGNKVYRETTYDFSGNQVNCFGDATFTIAHGADGRKTVTLQGAWSTSHSSYISGGSVAGSVTLPTIARATTPVLSVTEADISQEVTVSLNPASPDFTHTLRYSCNGVGEEFAEGVTGDVVWRVPSTLLSAIPGLQGVCNITCATYNGDTLIGTKTVALIVNIQADYGISIGTVNTTDPTGTASKYRAYVQYKSAYQFTANPYTNDGATIASVTVYIEGKKYTTTERPFVVTTDILTQAGTNSWTLTVTDSRGREKSTSSYYNVLEYIVPTIKAMSAVRCLEDGTESDEGEFIKVSFDTSITPLSNLNGNSVVVEWKKAGESEYSNRRLHSGYELTGFDIVPAGADDIYDIRLTITDDFTSATAGAKVGSTFTLLDFHKDGHGIAFGKAADRDGFDCAIPAYFKSIQTENGADVDAMKADIDAIKTQLGIS